MKINLLFLIGIFIWSLLANGQNYPSIHSSKKVIDIRDGSDFYEAEWTLAPEVKPDVYTSNKVGEKVTFYTDLDSISVVLKKDTEFNFFVIFR